MSKHINRQLAMAIHAFPTLDMGWEGECANKTDRPGATSANQ